MKLIFELVSWILCFGILATALEIPVVPNILDLVIPEEFEFNFDPDINRNVSQLITSKGYPVEDHTVQTDDGYLLSVQRIPHGRNETRAGLNGARPVVFLQHGLLSASTDFVVNFPEQSLGFILADQGYDVWMGNVRGNKYSRRHVKYDTNSVEFWNFSFDEMAVLDLPAMIDHVLNETGQKDLIYVGHSQGTTIAFALLSESPEYNKKIKLFIALAPVATVGYITSPIRYLAPFTYDLQFLLKVLGVKEFLPNRGIFKYLTEYGCDSPLKFLCEDIMFLLMGTDVQQLNMTRIAVYTTQLPAGTSTKSVIHFAQEVNSERFTKYDFGRSGNERQYNQTTPPEYDVTKITTPIALYWSLNDKLADPTDVGLLHQKLKSMVFSYLVPLPQFNHMDFAIALDAKTLLYDSVLDTMRKHAN